MKKRNGSSLIQQLLQSPYHVAGAILGARDTIANETKSLCLYGVYIVMGRDMQ